eukprot:gene4625-5232_t
MQTKILLVLLVVACAVTAYPRRSDLAIILDVSKSIKRDEFIDSLEFIENILYRKSISPGTTRVALITFSSKAYLRFSFEKYVNREGLLKRMKQLQESSLAGHTNINSALKKATYLFKKHKGLAKNKEVYIFSDGKWSICRHLLRDGLDSLRELNVKIFILGVGRSPDMRALEELATFPLTTHVFRLGRSRRHRMRVLYSLTGKEEYGYCQRPGERVVDECNRHCHCVDGILTGCYRLRREFTTLPWPERKRYVKAYMKLTSIEPLMSRYVTFINKHYYYFWKGIHGKRLFFPWHRWYIYKFENLMKEVDCRITLPFWDWSYYSDVAFEEGQHIWRNDEYGIGGNGDPDDSFCVKSGPFADSHWTPPGSTNVTAVVITTNYIQSHCHPIINVTANRKKCLQRGFNHKPLNLSHILYTLSLPCSKYDSFEVSVRIAYHNDMHNYIGGLMCTDFAANAPEFFFHHGFLDNIWYRWQHHRGQCADVFLKNHVTHLLTSNFRSDAFIDSHDQGQSVNVIYEDFLRGRLDSKMLNLNTKYDDAHMKNYSLCKEGGIFARTDTIAFSSDLR